MYWSNGKLIDQEFIEGEDPTLVPMVYEVFRVFKHKPLFLAEHMERLFHSIELLGFDQPYSRQKMESILDNLLDTEPVRIGNIKLRLSWWPAPLLEIGYIPHHYPTPADQTDGVVVSTFHAVRTTPNIKLWNAALRAQTNKEIEDKGVYEVLLVNEQGNITEGGRSNLFYVRNGILYTAPLVSVLPGVTRQKTIELSKVLNIKLSEQYLPEKEAGDVEEMFTSGTSAGICPIAEVNGTRLPKAKPVTIKLQQAYDRLVEEQLGPNNYGW